MCLQFESLERVTLYVTVGNRQERSKSETYFLLPSEVRRKVRCQVRLLVLSAMRRKVRCKVRLHTLALPMSIAMSKLAAPQSLPG